MMKLQGAIPPLLTPVDAHGNLDYAGLQNLINNCIEGGCEGIFMLGSAGEGSVVTASMRKEITANAVRIINGRVPLLVGILECSTQKAIEGIHELEEYGAENFVITPPYYLRVESQNEIKEHFRAVAASTRNNIVIYNIPCFTGCNIEPETYVELCRIDNIIGVKDSSEDWNQIQKALILKREEEFCFLCGHENLSGAAMLLGADGFIPGFGSAYPRIVTDLYRAAKAGDIQKMFDLEARTVLERKIWNCGGYWVAILKYLCERKGLCNAYTLKPAANLTQKQKDYIDYMLEQKEYLY